MSRARARAERAPLDAYLTPQRLADACCEHLFRLFAPPFEIVEPSAGEGAFVRAARARWPEAHVTAVDVDPTRKKALRAAGAHVVLVGDWRLVARQLAAAQLGRGRPRLALGNPPYCEAAEHVDATWQWLRSGDRLAYLLRLNFLGSAARVPFWRRPGLETVATVAPRPSFDGEGTDGTEYALFVWRKGYRSAPRLLRPLVWTPERSR